MESSTLVFAAIIPIFTVMVAGFLARRIGWLDEAADRSVMRVVVNLLYPAMIFSYVLGNDALKQPSNLILPPLVGTTSIVAGFGLCMLVARRLQLGNQKECRTFAFTTGLYNFGYFPIPIIALLFNRETAGVLLVHNLGVEFAMWALGVGFILAPNDPKSIWRRVFSGPVIAILVSAPLNLMAVDEHLPNFAFEAIDLLGRCAIPLGLLLIGATFADLAGESQHFKRLKIPVTACALRLGVLPLGFIAAAFLFPLPLELKAVMVVQAAMPCAVFPIVLARYFDGSPDVALKVVLSTTVLSLLTIPIWITVGMKVVGL